MSSQKDFFEEFEISKELGKGGYGSVYVATPLRGPNRNKPVYVAKFFDVRKIREKRFAVVDEEVRRGRVNLDQARSMKRRIVLSVGNDVRKEFELLKLLAEHDVPHTVRYVGYYPNVVREGRDYHVIVMTRVQGFTLSDLVSCYRKYKYIIKKNNIPKTFLRKITLDLLRTLKLLHDADIVHRDIKPANIIYDAKTHSIVYIDFGFSCLTALKTEDKNLLCEKRKVGSAGSYAPELLDQSFKKESLEVLKAVDVWELGVTFYRLENLDRPFKTDNDTLKNNREPSKGPDPLINELVEKMLTYDFRKRPSAAELVEWFEEKLAREV